MLAAVADKIIAVALPYKIIRRYLIYLAVMAVTLFLVYIIFGIAEGYLLIFVNSIVNGVYRVVYSLVVGLNTPAYIYRATKPLTFVAAGKDWSFLISSSDFFRVRNFEDATASARTKSSSS